MHRPGSPVLQLCSSAAESLQPQEAPAAPSGLAPAHLPREAGGGRSVGLCKLNVHVDPLHCKYLHYVPQNSDLALNFIKCATGNKTFHVNDSERTNGPSCLASSKPLLFPSPAIPSSPSFLWQQQLPSIITTFYVVYLLLYLLLLPACILFCWAPREAAPTNRFVV